MNNFRRWEQARFSTSDEGEYGLMPAMDITRDDGAEFHVHVYEDGQGGLTVHLYGSKNYQIDVNLDDDNEADITLR